MVFITVKGKKKNLSVCNVIHSQSSAWCSPQVSCPWPLPPLPSGLRHFHIQAEVPMKTKQRYLCRATATRKPCQYRKKRRCLAESLRTFRLQPRLQRKSPCEPVRKKKCWDPWRSLRKILRTECRWRRTGQDITASNKSQHYQPESMPRNSRSGGKGTCVLLGVDENWLPPTPGG